MNPEQMEEVDFSPLNEIIATQEAVLEDFKVEVEDLNNQISDLLVKVAELESELDNRNDAFTEIKELIHRYV